MKYNQFNFDWSLTERPIVMFIPNYDRKSYLDVTMKFFETNLNPSEYLIVVGNDGNDEDFSQWKDHNVVYFTYEREKYLRNGCYIRNFFIKNCKSQRIFQRDPEVVILGDYLSRALKSPAESIYRVGRVCPLSQSQGHLMMQGATRQTINEWIKNYRVVNPEAGTFIHWGFSAPTALLKEMRGYDQDFNTYGFEDTDLFYRLEMHGCKFICDEDVMAIHIWHKVESGNKRREQAMRDIYQRKSPQIFVRNSDEWGLGY